MIRGPRLLAVVAAVAALGAGLAGDAPEQRAGEVSAVRVAEWLRERRAIRIFDVREQAAHGSFAIPAAEHITRAALMTLPLERTDTVIVYGARDDVDAARAWKQLRARGVDASFLLRGGIDEWVARVMNPALPAGASPAEEAEFEHVAELSRYFGGVPRRTTPTDAPPDANAATPAGDAATQMEAVIRRGC